jgi:transposase
MFLPPENGSVSPGHKPKLRGSPKTQPPAMKKNHILGLDIAQKSAVAQLDRADGSRCWRGTVLTTQAGWQQLQSRLAEHGARLGDTQVLVEATGIYHLSWVERLTKAGAEVYVLNPLLAARLESSANALRGHKTDQVDVVRLCEIGRLHAAKLTRFRYQPELAQQGLKQLDHARRRLRATLTNLKKTVRSHLELVFPALLEAKIAPDTARAAAILEKAPTAGAWRSLPEVERKKLAREKQAALDQACAETLADEALAQACVPAVRALLSAQQAMTDQLRECDQQIVPRLPRERVALIASIPGFGERTAAVMATYLPASFAGWGSRKKIAARVQALFGFDPRLRQSGKWEGKVVMSKRGIAAGRTALFQAAFCSLDSDQDNAAYYRRLRDLEKKDHKEAIIDLMRKQVRRLVAVLCSNRAFEKKSLPHPDTALAKRPTRFAKKSPPAA